MEPQAAYTCFITGFKHKLIYFMRTVAHIEEHLPQVDQAVSKHFIPSITGAILCSDVERKLLPLPPKLGGLGIPIFETLSNFEFENSLKLTERLRENIIQQERRFDIDVKKINEIKNKIKVKRMERFKSLLTNLRESMPPEQIRLNDINCEIGASSWLTFLPLKEEGYRLNKQEFWDLLHIRYGKYGFPIRMGNFTCTSDMSMW